MQTNTSLSALVWAERLHEERCLLCGTVCPSTDPEQLHALGWHTWESHDLLPPHEEQVSAMELCPDCASDPMFVATSILKHHGLAYLEEWLRSVDLPCELGTRH